MKFATANDMLQYVQAGNDIWSPELNKYLFQYNDYGSICCYEIDLNDAKELERLSVASNPIDYWCAFLGTGGKIYDALCTLEETDRNGAIVEKENMYDHALELCNEYYKAEWIKCAEVLRI